LKWYVWGCPTLVSSFSAQTDLGFQGRQFASHLCPSNPFFAFIYSLVHWSAFCFPFFFIYPAHSYPLPSFGPPFRNERVQVNINGHFAINVICQTP
jgi:hypothetical protein